MGRINLGQFALVDDGDAIGHGQGLFLVMGHKDKGNASLRL